MDAVHVDRARNVFDDLLTHVLETETEFVAHLIVHNARNHDPSRISQSLKPCRHVHAITKNITAINYNVTNIDADPKLDTFVNRHVRISIGHTPLNINGTAHRVDDADELHQNPVAGCLDDTAPVLRDLRVHQFFAMHFEIVKSALFVDAHEAAVTGNIAGQNRGKSALDAILGHAEPTRSLP